jgi:DNA mismatch repair protein MutS2
MDRSTINASSALASIRREIERQRRGIQESLRSYLRHLSDGNALQDELVTIRGDRFVIPVKTEQKRRVQGVVHGASSSGQTVFIEPLETIEQNNELVRLLEDEQREIHRILLEMTARLGQQSEEILCAVDLLRELELQFAKARFAEQYHCTRVTLLPTTGGPYLPSVGECGEQEQSEGAPHLPQSADVGLSPSLILIDARHPVMERNLRARGKAVVPLTLEMDADHRQLIISGPNTGGKTVGLKTVGLLVLMAQAGIPVPAERAALPICDAVLADIGDSQSIEQNLSTFSAHVTNIDFISHTATARSLVLLDELGSATDPEEGAALAVAIAEHFRRVPGAHHHLHPPHRAQNLRRQLPRSPQRRRRLQ